jgi:hypothetical protein
MICLMALQQAKQWGGPANTGAPAPTVVAIERWPPHPRRVTPCQPGRGLLFMAAASSQQREPWRAGTGRRRAAELRPLTGDHRQLPRRWWLMRGS